MGISFFFFFVFFILPFPILSSLKHRPRPQRLSTCPHFVQVSELRSPTLITEYMFPSCKSQKWSLKDVSFVNLQNKILICMYMCVLLYVTIASWHTLVFVTINKNWVIIIFCSNVSLNFHSPWMCILFTTVKKSRIYFDYQQIFRPQGSVMYVNSFMSVWNLTSDVLKLVNTRALFACCSEILLTILQVF